jgi:hypothetical protein
LQGFSYEGEKLEKFAVLKPMHVTSRFTRFPSFVPYNEQLLYLLLSAIIMNLQAAEHAGQMDW